MEGARVYTKGSVKVNYCMNCDIQAENMIEVSGMIAGGSSYAAGGVSVMDIGNYTGLRTIVKAGQNDDFVKKEAQLNGKIYEVEEEVEMLQRALNDFQQKYSVEVRNTNPIYLKLEDAVYTKKTELEKLQEAKNNMNKYKERFADANIKVNGTIYEGSLIEIGGASWRAKTVSKVTLRKEGGRISIIN